VTQSHKRYFGPIERQSRGPVRASAIPRFTELPFGLTAYGGLLTPSASTAPSSARRRQAASPSWCRCLRPRRSAHRPVIARTLLFPPGRRPGPRCGPSALRSNEGVCPSARGDRHRFDPGGPRHPPNCQPSCDGRLRHPSIGPAENGGPRQCSDRHLRQQRLATRRSLPRAKAGQWRPSAPACVAASTSEVGARLLAMEPASSLASDPSSDAVLCREREGALVLFRCAGRYHSTLQKSQVFHPTLVVHVQRLARGSRVSRAPCRTSHPEPRREYACVRGLPNDGPPFPPFKTFEVNSGQVSAREQLKKQARELVINAYAILHLC
jgi:hypothetical protein